MSEFNKEARLPQGTIRYADEGSGEPLVFIHGLLVNGRLWERVTPLLSPDFRCIVPHLPLGCHTEPMAPGTDLTPPGIAKLILAFLDELGLDKVTLVGNDSGGAISQLVATSAPERISRLILTNCDAYDNFPPKLFAYFKPTARIPGAWTLLAQSMRIKPLRRSPIAFGVLTKKPIPGEMLDEWLTPTIENAQIRDDTKRFILGSDPALTEQAARDLESFTAPTLFAWAPEDRWFKVEHADRLAASMPNARVVRIPDAKTFVSLDQPQQLADAIASFMREPAAVAG